MCLRLNENKLSNVVNRLCNTGEKCSNNGNYY